MYLHHEPGISGGGDCDGTAGGLVTPLVPHSLLDLPGGRVVKSWWWSNICCLDCRYEKGWGRQQIVDTPVLHAMVQNNRMPFELGRRLVTGPRVTVSQSQAVRDKSSTGTENNKQSHKNTKIHTLNIIQLNVCGISNKKTEISKMLQETHTHILVLQESLHHNCDPRLPGYTHYCCNCNNCRGVTTYLRNDVQGDVEHVSNCNPTDAQRITVWFEGCKYTIYNIYNPPTNNLNTTHIQPTERTKTLLLGDFNGHSPQWGYQNYNHTGRAIEELSESTNLCVLQNPQTPPTLLHRAHNTLSRPDLTIISGDLIQKTTIKVLEDVGSDHKPILTQIAKGHRQTFERKPRWNFKKAKWEIFRTTLDEKLENSKTDETSAEELSQTLTTAILEAASAAIPRGCRRNFKPFWNTEIEETVNKRREARKVFEENPNLENKIQLNRASAIVKRTVKVAKRNKWTKTCATLDLKQSGKKAWALLNNLNNDNRKQNPRPMKTTDGTLTDAQRKAEAFNKHFAKVNKAHKLNKDDKEMLKTLKRREKAPSVSNSLFEEDFSFAELGKALRKLKERKSPGPDKVHNEMLLHLSHFGKKTLLNLLNLSWRTSKIPKMWKTSIIVPILKKDKPPEELGSYRPISLTSCIGKLFERMVNNRLYWWLETTGFLSAYQAGFRSGQRTEDQLFRLTQRIIDGFHENKHTTAVFVDLQQAYDRVWRKGLLTKMEKAGIHGNIYKWIKEFLCNRTITTKVENSFSSKQVQEEGLPQGSCLSCTLFLIYINDLPTELQSEKALYADDLTMWYTTKHLPIASNRLNEDLKNLDQYCEKWKLRVNCSKTVYSIFTKSAKASKRKLNLSVGGQKLAKEDNPSYLGMKLDKQLTLGNHVKNLKQKCTKRLLLVKRLASTTWGADKNTLRQLYLGYIRSVMEYCLPLQSICSKNTLGNLDKVQNNAIRHISGGLRSTPSAACEIHTDIEPLDLRRDASVMTMVERYKRLNPSHPNRELVDQWKSKPRLKKKSILQAAKDIENKHHLPTNRENTTVFNSIPPHKNMKAPTIKHHLIDENINKNSNPSEIKTIAEKTIDQYPPNWIHIYTDGSAHKGTSNAGYGAIINFPDKSKEEVFNPCGRTRSNVEAEALAMEASVRLLSSTFTLCPSKTQHAVIFTDSKSVLHSLQSEHNIKNSCINSLALEIHNFLNSHQTSLVLQWIPGHSNIAGNEHADTLAKHGASLPQPDPPISLHTAQQMIKSNRKEEWLNRWAQGTTGRCMFPHLTKPSKSDNINTLTRHQQVIIFRLRTQHIHLNNHLSKITSNTLPTCPLCQHPKETVTHHLFDCPPLSDIRHRYLPPKPNIDNTLYSGREQLINTYRFFTMARDRRAAAQQITGSEK